MKCDKIHKIINQHILGKDMWPKNNLYIYKAFPGCRLITTKFWLTPQWLFICLMVVTSSMLILHQQHVPLSSLKVPLRPSPLSTWKHLLTSAWTMVMITITRLCTWCWFSRALPVYARATPGEISSLMQWCKSCWYFPCRIKALVPASTQSEVPSSERCQFSIELSELTLPETMADDEVSGDFQ